MPGKDRANFEKEKERIRSFRASASSKDEHVICPLCDQCILPNQIRCKLGCGCQFHHDHYQEWSIQNVGQVCPVHPICILCKDSFYQGQPFKRLECGCFFHQEHYEKWSEENAGILCPSHKHQVPAIGPTVIVRSSCSLCKQGFKPDQEVYRTDCHCPFHKEHFEEWHAANDGQFCPNHPFCIICKGTFEKDQVVKQTYCGCLFHTDHYDKWSSRHPGIRCPVHYEPIAGVREESPEPVKRRKYEKHVCFTCKSHIPLKELYVADCGCKFHKYHFVIWREDHLFCPLHFYCFHDEGECSDFGCECQNQYEFTQKCFAPILADIPFDVGPDTRCTLYALPEDSDGRINENWIYHGMGHARVRESGGWEYLDFYPERPENIIRKYPIMHDIVFRQDGTHIIWEHEIKAQINTLDMPIYTLSLNFSCLEYATNFMKILERSIKFRKDRDELKKERAKGTCKTMRELYALREMRAVDANKQFKRDRDADLGEYAPIHAKASEDFNADVQRTIDYEVYDKREADQMRDEQRVENIRKVKDSLLSYSGCPPYLNQECSDEESDEEDYDESAPGPSNRMVVHQGAGGHNKSKCDKWPKYYDGDYSDEDLYDYSYPVQEARGPLSQEEMSRMQEDWAGDEAYFKGTTWKDEFSSEEEDDPEKYIPEKLPGFIYCWSCDKNLYPSELGLRAHHTKTICCGRDFHRGCVKTHNKHGYRGNWKAKITCPACLCELPEDVFSIFDGY